MLRPDTIPNTPEAAILLVRRHLPMRTAHAALTEMVDNGRAYVSVPMVEDVAVFIDELASAGVLAKRHAPGPLDVRAVRDSTSLSQEAFALRFGLDTATLRNWEQGRSAPDAAARSLLWTIFRSPEAVEAAIDMEEAPATAAPSR